MLEELKARNFPIHQATPKVKCKVFEDNGSCIEIATNHKTRPGTKHLSARLHHFRSHTLNKTITVEHVSTKHQLADVFTKALPRDQYMCLRNQIMGWDHHLESRGSERK